MRIFGFFQKREADQGSSEASLADTFPIGCDTLFEGAPPIIADVVFVHGLDGHRRNTWTKDKVCWPEQLLSQEESLSRTRVLTFGYNANITNIRGRASLNSLFEHSLNLLNELSRERRRNASDRPIIFVAHSLGGIIVKDALIHSGNVQGTQPHIAKIFTSTKGIIFLGTPHRGTGMASLAKVVASVVRVVHNPNISLIRDLERDSQTLDRIRDGFTRTLENHPFLIWSFVEELPTSGTEKVVSGDSAIINYSRENRETIHANHVGLAKFSNRKDPGYRKILGAIEVVLDGLGEVPPPAIQVEETPPVVAEPVVLQEEDPLALSGAAKYSKIGSSTGAVDKAAKPFR